MECPDTEWALLQAELPIDQVDWDLVKTYLFDRFSTPPSSYLASQGQTVIADVHSTRVCEHIMHLRPCPSFFDASYHCQGLHPEFLLQGMDVIWTPRTWCCRAFQRRIDLTTPDRCHVPGCQQLHRPGWAHCELVAFRAWALRVDRSHWFTIYCRQPNVNGKLPLYIVHYQDIVYCLRHQGYLPYASFIKHSWKETVEPPLTYLHDYASLVKPFAANYYDDERVQQRRALHRQRSQTPRRPRPEPSQPATTADNFLQQNEPVQPSPVPPHFGTGTPPRSRQPTGSSHQHQPSSFPTPKSNPTSFRPPVQTPYDNRPTPITNPCSTPIAPPSPAYTQTWPEVPTDPWAEDSDGLQPTSRPSSHSSSQLATVHGPPDQHPFLPPQLFHPTHSQSILPRLCHLPDWRWTVRSIRQLADAYPSSGRHILSPLPDLQWSELLSDDDMVGHAVQTDLPPSQPTRIFRTDPYHSTANQHSWPRGGHFDQLLLHQDEPRTGSGIPEPEQRSLDHHKEPDPRMAKLRWRPISAIPHSTRLFRQVQLQRGHRDPGPTIGQHPWTPTNLGRLRPEHQRGPHHRQTAVPPMNQHQWRFSPPWGVVESRRWTTSEQCTIVLAIEPTDPLWITDKVGDSRRDTTIGDNPWYQSPFTWVVFLIQTLSF